MHESSQDGIENQIKVFAHILRQESQYEISVLLQQGIFAPIPAVRFGVGQMLRAVQLDDDARLHATGNPRVEQLVAVLLVSPRGEFMSCRATSARTGRGPALGFVAVRENWPSLYG